MKSFSLQHNENTFFINVGLKFIYRLYSRSYEIRHEYTYVNIVYRSVVCIQNLNRLIEKSESLLCSIKLYSLGGAATPTEVNLYVSSK